jgi:ornithine cyclodeaminase
VLFLTNEDVAAAVGPIDALAAVRDAFRGWGEARAAVQDRVRTAVGEVKLSILGAVVLDDTDPDGGIIGAKVYSTVGGRFTFLITLFAASDGRRLAVLEADTVTRLRTAATSTMAVQLLARRDTPRVVVHGSGVQALSHVEALAAALPSPTFMLVGRTRPVEEAAELTARCGAEVIPSDDRQAGLEEATIVITATRSAVPLFPGIALAPGTTVCAIGSSRRETRELDDDSYAGASRVVVEWRQAARREAGGLVEAAEAGLVDWDDVVELADVVTGRSVGRVDDAERIVYQSVGIGLEDVAVAAVAVRAGVGTRL